MKRFLKVTIFVIIVFIILFCFGIGGKRTDVFLHDFSVSEDGTKINLKVGVSSSAGYIRTLYVKQGGDNKYITFFSTFGINNKLGSKNEFEIELNPSCEEIFFYNGDGGYKSILQKNADGEWEINRKNESTYDNPKVPNGFKKVETETASWEEDENGNYDLVMASSSKDKMYAFISSMSERFTLVEFIATGIVFIRDHKTNVYTPFISKRGKYCRYDKEIGKIVEV